MAGHFIVRELAPAEGGEDRGLQLRAGTRDDACGDILAEIGVRDGDHCRFADIGMTIKHAFHRHRSDLKAAAVDDVLFAVGKKQKIRLRP